MHRLLILGALGLLAALSLRPALALPAGDELVHKVTAQKFTDAPQKRVSQRMALTAGEDLKIVLPRLYGGHIWKRRVEDDPAGCLKYLKDDQFYDSSQARPGDVSYVAYIYHAETAGHVKIEFRHLRPRETFDHEGPSLVLDLDIKQP
jgi:hypothetical protein